MYFAFPGKHSSSLSTLTSLMATAGEDRKEEERSEEERDRHVEDSWDKMEKP